jgi:hypothetical protein
MAKEQLEFILHIFNFHRVYYFIMIKTDLTETEQCFQGQKYLRKSMKKYSEAT